MPHDYDIGAAAIIREGFKGVPEQPPVITITVRSGERHEAADAGIKALYAAKVPFYQRDRNLVRVCQVKARSTTGEIIMVPGIAEVTQSYLDRALGQVAVWQKFNKKSDGFVRIDPPDAVAKQILNMTGEWPFPPLAGVIGCPTMRPDGSLLVNDGYDPATALALISTVEMPPIPEAPTREDAEQALAFLKHLLREFPFADKASQAVGLSMMMTPVLRGAMETAPMHLVTAPQPGTGKSYLADVASMIATGERVAVVAVAPNPEETEKRLVGNAISGHPVIGLDNCRETLEGDFLCQVTERPLMKLRALGKSDPIRIANTFTVFANGNNVSVATDMVRRTIRCGLDANVENPECREFEDKPIDIVRANRGPYIAAILTFARAYIAAGRPGLLPPLASYEAWSNLVRSSLVWLGCADPVDTMDSSRDDDPVRQDRDRVFDAWRHELTIGEGYLAPELADLAQERQSYDGTPRRPKLNEALLEIAQKRGAPGQIEPKRLGRWLAANENTIAYGVKLRVDKSDRSRTRYILRPIK